MVQGVKIWIRPLYCSGGGGDHLFPDQHKNRSSLFHRRGRFTCSESDLQRHSGSKVQVKVF
jgi:hypothetical protein